MTENRTLGRPVSLFPGSQQGLSGPADITAAAARHLKLKKAIALRAYLKHIPGLGSTIMTEQTQALAVTAELTGHSKAPDADTSYLLKEAVGLCQVLQQLLIRSDHQHLQQNIDRKRCQTTTARIRRQQHRTVWYAAKLLVSQTRAASPHDFDLVQTR